jgi:hypothetical protein
LADPKTQERPKSSWSIIYSCSLMQTLTEVLMSLVQTMGVDTDRGMRTVGGACLMGQKNPWIETELPTDARVRKQSG